MRPERDEALAGGAAQGSEDRIQNNATILADSPLSGNFPGRIEAIKAQLAQRGYTLHVLHDGSFFVARWNLCKPLAGLRELVHFARQIGGAA